MSLLTDRPEFGTRYIAEFYAGMPEIIDPTAPAPTSRYDYEFLDYRGTTMLKIYLLPPMGGDNSLWQLENDRLVEQIFGPQWQGHGGEVHRRTSLTQRRRISSRLARRLQSRTQSIYRRSQ